MKIFGKLVQRIKRKKETEIEGPLFPEVKEGEEIEEEKVEEGKISVEELDDIDTDETTEEMPEDDLLEELKREDLMSIEEEYDIMKELEDVTVEELVEDLSDLVKTLQRVGESA
ncbi:MAG: hypothetical protein ACXQT5_03530 [Candidatus Syntropharchaeia archaeon]